MSIFIELKNSVEKNWAEISQIEIGVNIFGFFCFTK